MNYDLESINNAAGVRERLSFKQALNKANAVQPKTLIRSQSGVNQVLYPLAKFNHLMAPSDSNSISSGLVNLNNSCFMNASLQCIAATNPFLNSCLRKEHSKTCQNRGRFCSFCTIEQTVRNMANKRNRVTRPAALFTKLKQLSKTLRPGRQEDAHEFIRVLLDSLQEVSKLPYKNKIRIDNRSQKDPLKQIQYTTLIYHTWGGALRSTVTCSKCRKESNKDDPMLGISLATAGSLEKSFKKYTKPEQLSGNNRYYCEHCKRKHNAHKRICILKPPVILQVHLKRFEFNEDGNRRKICHKVSFKRTLDVSPFLYNKSTRADYELFGVLVHSGSSAHGGHYYSYVKEPCSDRWYLMNDSSVKQVSLKKVLESQAYIIFYQQSKRSLDRTMKSRKPETVVPVGKPIRSVTTKKSESGITDMTLMSRIFPKGKKIGRRKEKSDGLKQLEEMFDSAKGRSPGKRKKRTVEPPAQPKARRASLESPKNRRKQGRTSFKRKASFEISGPNKRRKKSLMNCMETHPKELKQLRQLTLQVKKRPPTVQVSFAANSKQKPREKPTSKGKKKPKKNTRTVGRWDGGSQNLTQTFFKSGKRKQRSKWDAHLDVGKLPKVRKK